MIKWLCTSNRQIRQLGWNCAQRNEDTFKCFGFCVSTVVWSMEHVECISFARFVFLMIRARICPSVHRNIVKIHVFDIYSVKMHSEYVIPKALWPLPLPLHLYFGSQKFQTDKNIKNQRQIIISGRLDGKVLNEFRSRETHLLT